MASFTLQINGHSRSVDAEPSTPLLYVLREDCELKGTRFGCGSGHCGACTVLIDGQAVQSCDITVSSVTRSRILTVESADPGHVSAAAEPLAALLGIVRQAFLELQAAQCGYCINGIMMSACALISSHPSPSRQDIARGLSRHLCRCGTHHRILQAVSLAAQRAREAGLAKASAT